MLIHVLRRLPMLGAVLALSVLPLQLDATGRQDAPGAYPAMVPDERDWSDDIPAHLSVVEGAATLERDGRVETAEENLILLSGDRLRTGRGRVEVLFDDGSALHLDEHSTVDFMSDALIRLRQGRLRLQVVRTSRAIEYRVDAAPASAVLLAAGEYRIALADGRSSDPELRLVVMRGSAELVNHAGRTMVRAGTEAFASMDRAPSLPYAVNSAAWDSFERWAQSAMDARLGVQSARYLPADVRYYSGVFDTYGTWGYEPVYGGYVWYPRVTSGWRPYSVGRWSFVGHFGWTWIGHDRWSWATHHYGRWGVSTGRWYWVPHSRWAPAWVAWGYAPGYVSWCPLGWDGRAVFGFSYYGGYRDWWSAWTIVPARVFVTNVVVTNHVVRHEAIAPTVRSQFAEARRAPTGPVAASRAEPLRAPTGPRAVPRNTMSAPPPAAWPDRRSATSRVGNEAPARDNAGARTAPPTSDIERAAPSRTRPSVVNPPWVGGSDPQNGESRGSDPRAAPRSRVPEAAVDPGRSDPGSRVARPREPDPSPAARPSAPRWNAPESRPADPPDARPGSFGSRVAPRPSDPPPPPPSRSQAEPRGGSGPPPAAQPSRGGGDSRTPPPAAAPSRGGGDPGPPSSARPGRGGGGGAQPRGRGGA